MYIYTFIHIYLYSYIYICTYIHTYIHTHTPVLEGDRAQKEKKKDVTCTCCDWVSCMPQRERACAWERKREKENEIKCVYTRTLYIRTCKIVHEIARHVLHTCMCMRIIMYLQIPARIYIDVDISTKEPYSLGRLWRTDRNTSVANRAAIDA